MNTFETLRKIPFFESLDDDELRKIASISKEERIAVNTIVFKEGMPGDAMYVIRSGSIRVAKSLGKGEEETLSFLGEGEFFGEMALLDGGLRSASAIAVEETEVLVISKDDFMNLLMTNGPLAVKFFLTIIKVFSERLRQTNENFKNILLKQLENKKK